MSQPTVQDLVAHLLTLDPTLEIVTNSEEWENEGDYVAIDSEFLATLPISKEEQPKDKTRVRKSIFVFTVFHRVDDVPDSLERAMAEAYDGGMVGMETFVSEVSVPEDKLVDELVAIGNDGSFFDEIDCGDDNEGNVEGWFFGTPNEEEEEDVVGCSCGMADYGAPGHDGSEDDHSEEEEDDGPREHRYNSAPYCAKCGGKCEMDKNN